MTPEEAVREMAEKRHGDGAMFYAKEILSIIEAHHQLGRIANDPKFPPEVRAQRKAILGVGQKILRAEAQKLFSEYFIPEFDNWMKNS